MPYGGGVKRKVLVSVAICCDLLLLFIFKYLTFITKNISFISNNDKHIVEIALPIGISFFTFQMMSYIFDVYNGNARAQKNPLHVILYIFLFPQLIAGPIVRYKTIENEITERNETSDEFTQGITRFVYGLGKKVLIANNVAFIADTAFGNIDGSSVATLWLGAVSYMLQIYFDFSGYSDMAIGLGLLFGFHFPENFNYPYIAKSITDFWHRWHISLSTWFRDYVYIPLGGSRVSKTKYIRNIFIVWFLTGIWHGANWTFIAWGLIYFFFLLIEKFIGKEKIEIHNVISRVYTLLVVLFAWIVFRADSIKDAVLYIKTMFGLNANLVVDDYFISLIYGGKIMLFFAVLLSVPIYAKIKKVVSKRVISVVDSVAIFLIFILSAISCLSSAYNPFIYFNF